MMDVVGRIWAWLLVACALGAPAIRADPLRLAGATMGTTYSVEIARVPGTIDARALRATVEATLGAVDRLASTWRADSELSQFNARATTAWVPVSPMLATLVAEALGVSRLSGGALDPTVAPLVALWGFGPGGGSGRRPCAQAVRAARARVGFAALQARTAPPALRKERADVTVDLSAVAKGFAVDRVAARLAALGLSDVLVEIGGEMRARGRNPGGEPWAVAVQEPSGAAGVASAVLRLDDAAIATSGDYRNHFEEDGRRHAHVLDPRTGEPIAHALASVTVVAGSAMQADALATALLVLGPEAGPVLARRERLPALFITRVDDGFETMATAELGPYRVR